MMDILEKYNAERPEPRPASPGPEGLSEEYGALTRLVMRFSGGRIQNAQQANIALIVIAVIIFGISLVILFAPQGRNRPLPPGRIINIPGQPPRLYPTITPQT